MSNNQLKEVDDSLLPHVSSTFLSSLDCYLVVHNIVLVGGLLHSLKLLNPCNPSIDYSGKKILLNRLVHLPRLRGLEGSNMCFQGVPRFESSLDLFLPLLFGPANSITYYLSHVVEFSFNSRGLFVRSWSPTTFQNLVSLYM